MNQNNLHQLHKTSVHIISFILTIKILSLAPSVHSQTTKKANDYTNNSVTQADKNPEFYIFPVGINIEKRTVNTSALIKGAEDGAAAINLAQWLIPFDLVVAALKIKVTTLDNGLLELRSPGIVTRIDPQQLQTDQDLGLVWQVSQIRNILGVTTQFDLNDYAITFHPPWLNLKSQPTVTELPISTTGLTKIHPASFTFSTMGQSLRFNNRDFGNRSFNSQSDFRLLGTIFGGSWYSKINQGNLTDVGTWQLGELQYLRQTDKIDYALGSHPTFWQSSQIGQYWGLTSIRRFGFNPQQNSSSGGFNANLRRQPQIINRSLTGTTQPGDLVRLVTKHRQEIVQEISVDQTGNYQFINVNSRDSDYQILVYPQGRLTAIPEVRDVIMTHVSGQLSPGTSTVATSLGIRRDLTEDSFMGKFNRWGGGVNYRRGMTEELTLGTGLVMDDSLFGMGELFYQPNNVPLQLGMSALINPKLENSDYTALFNYQPTAKLNLNFNGNRSGHNFRLNWRATPTFNFNLSSSHRDNLATGITFSHNSWLGKNGHRQRFSLLTRLDYGDCQGFKQRIDTRYHTLSFFHQGDRDATFSRLNYYLTDNAFNPQGQSLFLGYDTRNSEQLINMGWRYRSGQTRDGSNSWDIELGYGFNDRGSAPLAAVTTRAIPGTTLRLSYEGISTVNNNSQVRIDVAPNLLLQGRPSLGDRNLTKLRTQGGLLVRPFGDLNTNGKLDRGEKIYTEDAELLLIVNHKSLKPNRQNITPQGVYVPLSPGEYRLGLDSAGLPFNFQPTESDYGVQVTAGSYTKLDIPLNPSYTVMGAVTNSQGEPVVGMRVQATAHQSAKPIVSVTNSAGIYFLEGLTQDTYKITVNNQAVDTPPLSITADSEPLQEINLQY